MPDDKFAAELTELLSKLRPSLRSGVLDRLPSLIEQLEAVEEQAVTSSESLLRLRELYSRFAETYDFHLGDLVQWKDGLKNKRLPAYRQPAIVVETLDVPVRDPKDAGSAYFREPLDFVLGVVDTDGDFLLFHFDKRRFEPFDSSRPQQ